MFTKEEVIFHPRPVNIMMRDKTKLTGPLTVKKAAQASQLSNGNISTNDVIKTKPQDLVSKTGACIKYVCSKVTLYYSSRIELKWRRALHYCDTCKYGDDNTPNSLCGAIHYGICMPVVGKSFRPPVLNKPARNSSVNKVRSTNLSQSGQIPISTSSVPSHPFDIQVKHTVI